ncbi:DUF982 domain-containing protein [Rhizobium sp.]
MYDIPWSKPIRLEFPRRLPRIIDGPRAALDLLDNEWPSRKGRHYAAARDMCRAAIARLTSPDAARETFISASIEAAVPIR